jgi:Domain of unknown function (DUF4337)
VSTEHGEDKAARRRFEAGVGVTLACIVAVVASVAVFRRLAVAEQLRARQVATEEWQSYQFKGIERHQTELLLPRLAVRSSEREGQSLKLKLLQQEQQQTERDAREAENSSDSAHRKGFLFRLGQAGLELALVLGLLAIFTRCGILWAGAVAGALAGVAVAAFALWS